MQEFDPSKPFEVVDPEDELKEEPSFDPNKPFEMVAPGGRSSFNFEAPFELVNSRL